jgi:GH15 family glucan-1,4-alpha-glucosidase
LELHFTNTHINTSTQPPRCDTKLRENVNEVRCRWTGPAHDAYGNGLHAGKLLQLMTIVHGYANPSQIEEYGLIGNMRTCALVATDGGLDFMCWPDFDSPSVFARMLDNDKGGHFTISPAGDALSTTKQHYLPSSNILQTRYLREDGVMNVVDFFPRPNDKSRDAEFHASVLKGKQRGEVLTNGAERPDLKKWLIRRVECMRGEIDVDVEIFPAFSE